MDFLLLLKVVMIIYIFIATLFFYGIYEALEKKYSQEHKTFYIIIVAAIASFLWLPLFIKNGKRG